jgi:hypothetical protein
VQRWLVKIEDEDSSRGLAYVDVACLPGVAEELADAMEKLAMLTEHYQSRQGRRQVGSLWPRAQAALLQAGPIEDLRAHVESAVTELLLKHLRRALVLVSPAGYPSYRAFVEVRLWQSCFEAQSSPAASLVHL